MIYVNTFLPKLVSPSHGFGEMWALGRVITVEGSIGGGLAIEQIAFGCIIMQMLELPDVRQQY